MTTSNALILGMEHPEDQEIQICANEDPEVTSGHILRGQFDIVETFKNHLLTTHRSECIDVCREGGHISY